MRLFAREHEYKRLVVLDNHSVHWFADQPAHRFQFTFRHGPWPDLVEGFFSKLARSVLPHIRAASKQELKDRITAAMDHFNQHPVVHTWAYSSIRPHNIIRISKTLI
jgi:hypothetical protein